MQVAVTFRHMGASDPLKEHAAERVERIKKYLHTQEFTDAHVILSIEKYRHKAEVNVAAHGLKMHGEESSDDMYNSIDRAVSKIEKQLRRYKDRLIARKPRDGARVKLRLNVVEAPEESEHAALPAQIAETKELEVSPMLLDEAIMEMDLSGQDIFLFMNTKTHHLNVLYRKKNHKLGLIEAGSLPSHA